MDSHGTEVIQRNIDRLIKHTRCNSELITKLQSLEVFSQSDADDLVSIPKQLDRALEFYKIIQTKECGFDHLLNSLKATNQTGAVSILEGGSQSTSASSTSSCISNDNDQYEHTPLTIEPPGESRNPKFNRSVQFRIVMLITCTLVVGTVVIIIKTTLPDTDSNRVNRSILENHVANETTEPDLISTRPSVKQTTKLQTHVLVAEHTQDSGCDGENKSTDLISLLSNSFQGCPDTPACPCWSDKPHADMRCKERSLTKRWDFQHLGVTCYCCGKV